MSRKCDPRPASTSAKILLISIQLPESITAQMYTYRRQLQSHVFLSLFPLALAVVAPVVNHSFSWMPLPKPMHLQVTPTLQFTTCIRNGCLCLHSSSARLIDSLVCDPMVSQARICHPHVMYFEHDLAVHFLHGHIGVDLSANNRVGRLPDLEDIVLGGTGDKPWVVGIPAEVGQVVRVTAVHE